MKRLTAPRKDKAYKYLLEFYLLSKVRHDLENQTRSLTDAEYREYVNQINHIARNISTLRTEINAIIF